MKTVVLIRLFITFILFYTPSVKTAAQSISGVVNSYYRVTAINTITNTLTLNTTAGLGIEARVMIIQMKGASITSTNDINFGNVSAIGNAGNYELNYICGIAGNDVLLALPLARTYTNGGPVQMVTVPRYNVVTVTGTLTASTWDAAAGTGGVLAIEADTILLNSNIDVSGRGFAGGALQNYPTPGYDCNAGVTVSNFSYPLMAPAASPPPGQMVQAAPKGEGIAAFIASQEYGKGKQANGGGGGNNHNSGGGGGSNYGAGGQGGTKSLESLFQCHGQHPGIGGGSISTQGYTVGNNRIFMGGGGGAGHQNNAVGHPGGVGGGIAYVSANVIVGAGTRIMADGARSSNPAVAVDPLSAGGDGGGGGGGGGTVILNVNFVNGNIDASAIGARGSDAARTGTVSDCPGAGGGGGGGVVWMKGGSPIANVTTFVTGGANGTGSPLSPNVSCRNTAAGATSGANGAQLTGYIRPISSSPFVCEPLPIHELKSFTGRASESGNELRWEMRSLEDITGFEVERTIDRVRYTTIASKPNNGSFTYSLTDGEKITGTCYYRLKVIRANRRVDYSSVVRVNSISPSSFQWLSMHPNPASQQVQLTVFVKQNTSATITVLNGKAQAAIRQTNRVSNGYNRITLSLDELPAGTYWVTVEVDGERSVKTLIRQ